MTGYRGALPGDRRSSFSRPVSEMRQACSRNLYLYPPALRDYARASLMVTSSGYRKTVRQTALQQRAGAMHAADMVELSY
ncbi:unnamed protein product [Ectocarpus sp. CCAP 1310/34]|nr:unnamed protein product [Ectocarpus sp. CCAP 1310/34]